MRKLFITGTGTDVGKTFVTAGLALLAETLGLKTAVMKPTQTGVANFADGDLGIIHRLATKLIKLPENLACPYCFPLPASPHLAAAEVGEVVDTKRILQALENIEKNHDPDLLLIEGAGGLYVPLIDNHFMIDLIAEMGASVILTSLAGLGTLNHTFLSLKALKSANIATSGVIFNRMPEKPSPIELDNPKTISRLSGIPTLAILKEINYANDSELRARLLEGMTGSNVLYKILRED